VNQMQTRTRPGCLYLYDDTIAICCSMNTLSSRRHEVLWLIVRTNKKYNYCSWGDYDASQMHNIDTHVIIAATEA